MQKATRSRSFLPKSILITVLGLITSIGYNAAAVDVVTDPVGFITLTAFGTNNSPGANPYLTLVGLGMTQVPSALGSISGVSGKQVTVGSALTAAQFTPVAGGPNPAYFIEFVGSGVMDDITSNNTTTIFTAFDDSGTMTAGATKFKVYPHWTIGTVFGSQNQAGFQGGANAGVADNVQVWNPNSQGFSVYYFKTTGLGGTGWRSNASTSINTSNTVLYIDQGILLSRRVTGDVAVKLVGGVKLTNTVSVIVTNGLTFAGNVYPAGLPLGTSGLYTGSPTTGLNGGANAGVADNVQVWTPSVQGYTVYYFKTTGLGGTGWRSNASTSINTATNTIPLGAMGLIVRRAGNPTFNWVIPQPFVQ
jgi:uncharacterized protein (TIGR02597 family)